MKQEDLFKKLGLILNELNEQYQFLVDHPQQFSELELELFQANADFLTEHVQIIKKINSNQQELSASQALNGEQHEVENSLVLVNDTHEEFQLAEVTFADENEEESILPKELPLEESLATAIVEEKAEPIIQFEEIEKEVFKIDNEPSSFEFILNDHAEHEKFDYEEKSVNELFNRPLSEDEQHILAQKRKIIEEPNLEEFNENDEDEIGPEPFLVHKEVEQIQVQEEVLTTKEDLKLEEAPVDEVIVTRQTAPVEDPTYKPTLNDLLAKSNVTNINAATTAVKDLKQAINLNDKLLYIKDLFNGYNLAYAEAIDLANKMPNFEAADNFFQKNYAAKNNWAQKQATVDKFYQLLNQRFK